MISPLVLIILDGWGIALPGPGNAITQAETPQMDRLWAGFPHTQLAAAGEAVGLPHGEDGNTETGHLNIGAGQIVYQDLPRINISIADGSFFQNVAFINATSHIQAHQGKLHLLGLIGSGGVHSNMDHLFALMRLAKQRGCPEVYLHLITDGRDSPPASALTYVAQVKQEIAKIGIGQIASVMGRYYAMDRDHRWERTAKAYFCLIRGSQITAPSAEVAVKTSYQQNKNDEFIEPTTIVDDRRQPRALVEANDGLIFFNFRIDRPRQLTKAFVLPDFKKQATREEFDPFTIKYYQTHLQQRREAGSEPFDRGEQISDLYFVTMTSYEVNLPVDVAFPPQTINMPLGRVLSERGWRQLRLAETEKERFVTYYFNGQREEPFPGEDRLVVPSPALPTYDLKPEMSTPELQKVLLNELQKGIYEVIIVNVACPDMVAHTGNLKATIKACEAADHFVGMVVPRVLNLGGGVLICADHGNAEEMINPVTGGTDTEHSIFPVPFITAVERLRGKSQYLQSGILADIAPTMIKFLGVEKPVTMTGKSLL